MHDLAIIKSLNENPKAANTHIKKTVRFGQPTKDAKCKSFTQH